MNNFWLFVAINPSSEAPVGSQSEMWEVFEAIQQEKATLILNKIEFPDGRKCYAISSTQEAPI